MSRICFDELMDHPAISALVAGEYGLGTPSDCTLLSLGMNEVYRVDLPAGPYALRIHGENKWWLEDEGSVRFELDLLTHLHDHGVRCRPRCRDATAISWAGFSTTAPNADTRCSPGLRDSGGSTKEHARLIGRVIAEIHVWSDRFQTELPRVATELRVEIERIRDRLRAFDPGPTGWGIIHGDPQDLNYHLTADGKIKIFDFDLCGFGWRAYDFACYYTRIAERFRQSALDGYESVRPLSLVEREMIPTFGQAAWIKEGTMVGSGLHPEELAKNLADPFQF